MASYGNYIFPKPLVHDPLNLDLPAFATDGGFYWAVAEPNNAFEIAGNLTARRVRDALAGGLCLMGTR